MKKILCLLLLVIFSATATESFVDVNGAKLFCHTVGEGNPLIVIHGGPGLSQGYLLPYMEKLGDHQEVVFYDQRACGKSDGALNDVSPDQFVEDIEGVRKAFGFDKVSLLGHSWGGHLAMKYAIKHPENVDKLVLLNSACLSSSDFMLFLNDWSRRMAPYMNQLEALQHSKEFAVGDPETMANYFKIIFRTYCFSPASVDKLNILSSSEANIKWIEVGGILNQILLSIPFDLSEDLKKVDCQTLVVHGDVDPIPLSTVENIHRCLPNSTLKVIQECGHFPFVEKPDELFDILNNFLSSKRLY